jgi:hypothetical protein
MRYAAPVVTLRALHHDGVLIPAGSIGSVMGEGEYAQSFEVAFEIDGLQLYPELTRGQFRMATEADLGAALAQGGWVEA